MHSQEVIQLYDVLPNRTANSLTGEVVEQNEKEGWSFVKNVTNPTLTAYIPKKHNGVGVIICPGGAYVGVAIDHEGHDIARKLNEKGVAAFVLKYRMPNEDFFENAKDVPLLDVQRSIQIIRTTQSWKIKKLGVLGSSAGGHLAAMASTSYKDIGNGSKKALSLKPDFTILNYPVISMIDEALCHKYSRMLLLGDQSGNENDPIDDDLKKAYSPELHIDKNCPPAFITHAMDDDGVPIGNSLLYGAVLQRHNIPVEYYFYQKGGHGYGIVNKSSSKQWIDSCITWILKL